MKPKAKKKKTKKHTQKRKQHLCYCLDQYTQSYKYFIKKSPVGIIYTIGCLASKILS